MALPIEQRLMPEEVILHQWRVGTSQVCLTQYRVICESDNGFFDDVFLDRITQVGIDIDFGTPRFFLYTGGENGSCIVSDDIEENHDLIEEIRLQINIARRNLVFGVPTYKTQ